MISQNNDTDKIFKEIIRKLVVPLFRRNIPQNITACEFFRVNLK